MASTAGTITVPIFAEFGGKKIHLGDVTFDAKVVAGRIKAPNEREIKSAIRRGLR